MRIISGTLKGRKLLTPRKGLLRPTSDRVKESMFNILGPEVEGKVVLDLFAGTGNLGIEALSRGARKAVFVEKNREAFRLVQRNLLNCGMTERSEVLLKEIDQGLRLLGTQDRRFDLIFMDPPYEKGLIRKTLEVLATRVVYHPDSIVVLEHDRREPLPNLSGSWTLLRQRRTGDTLLSFLAPILRDRPDRAGLNDGDARKH
jgi:16S rRNA (guanine(966)-N(2))-methyltransferase RsmD